MAITSWILDFIINYGLKILVIAIVYSGVKTALMFLYAARKGLNRRYKKWLRKKFG